MKNGLNQHMTEKTKTLEVVNIEMAKAIFFNYLSIPEISQGLQYRFIFVYMYCTLSQSFSIVCQIGMIFV